MYVVLVLTFWSCGDKTTSGTTDTTDTGIALEGKVITQNSEGVSGLLVKIANTELSDVTEQNGHYLIEVSSDSLDKIGVSIDSLSSQIEIISEGSLIKTLELKNWIDSLPDVLLEQRNITGKLIGNMNAISKIEVVITNLSNPEIPSKTLQAWKNSLSNGYSTFAYFQPVTITAVYRVYTRIYTYGNSVTGISQIVEFPSSAGDIEVPEFTIWNSIPSILSNDITASISDTVILSPTVTDFGGTIVKYEWDIGNTGNFEVLGGSEVSVVTPSMGDEDYMVVLKVTDNDSNVVVDTIHIEVLSFLDGAPFVKNLSIVGTPHVDSVLMTQYDFIDNEEDLQGNTQFKWMRDSVPIIGATYGSYIVAPDDIGTTLGVEVTPVSVTGKGLVGYPTVEQIGVNTFTDERDGQVYRYTIIGEQYWMAQNLNFDTLDGRGSSCFNNVKKNCEKYGRIYNWSTIMNNEQGYSVDPLNDTVPKLKGLSSVCPEGWRVPSYHEWKQMVDYVATENGLSSEIKYGNWGTLLGDYLQSKSGWSVQSSIRGGKDLYDFTALPTNGLNTAYWKTATPYIEVAIESEDWLSRAMLGELKVYNAYPNDQMASLRCFSTNAPYAYISKPLVDQTFVDQPVTFNGYQSSKPINGSDITYNWYTIDSAHTSSDRTFIFTPVDTGQVYIVLEVTDGNKVDGDTINIVVR